jgi:uncharacterized protein involved in exopolysaccharide biosynthesis
MSNDINTEQKHQLDDEIDLIELAAIIWKRKLYIIGFVFVVSVITVIYTLSLDNIYESKAVLKPTAQTSTQNSLGGLSSLAGFAGININSGGSVYADISVLLSDKSFISKFVKMNEFAPVIVYDKKLLQEQDFIDNENLNFYELIKTNLTFSEDKNTNYVTIKYTHEKPVVAKNILSSLLIGISDELRANQMENIDKRIENYKLEIERANDITLKNKLSEMVANLIQSKVLANADEYYGFSIISEPSLSEPMDKAGPKRTQISIIAFIISFLGSVFAVIIYEYLKTTSTKGGSHDSN